MARSYEGELRRRREVAEELARQRAEAARQARTARIAAEKARRGQLLAMAADLRAADKIRSLVARFVETRGSEDAAQRQSGADGRLQSRTSRSPPSGSPSTRRAV